MRSSRQHHPTFVINEAHIISHWNKAMEKLTAFPPSRPSYQPAVFPFYDSRGRRWPTLSSVKATNTKLCAFMAPLAQVRAHRQRLRGGSFLPSLGASGKWCWFTAAPSSLQMAASSGIETLWDRTEDKRSEQERERHTRN